MSLKGISGDKTIKQDDNNKQLSQLSMFRHELDDGNNESIVQQSFVLIAGDETIRRLGTTQVNCRYVFFLILAFCYCLILDCVFCVGHDHLLIPYLFLFL